MGLAQVPIPIPRPLAEPEPGPLFVSVFVQPHRRHTRL
jgi:hypothetical protein